jgi:hypothetical protein
MGLSCVAEKTSTSTPAALKGGATKAKKEKPKSAIEFGRGNGTRDAERWTVSFPKRGRIQIPRREVLAFPLEPSPSAGNAEGSSSEPWDFSPLGSEDRRNKFILRRDRG